VITAGDHELGVSMVRDIATLRRLLARLWTAIGRETAASTAIDPDEPESPGAADVPVRGAPPARAAAADHAPFAFPIMLDVRTRRVVVAGGGREPAHKAVALAGLGARVLVWAEHHRETALLERQPRIELRSGSFDPVFLDGALLAIIATGDRALDREIATEARARAVLVNTVDDTPYCDWSAPAILRRGDLTVSVATAGIAPALAVRLRDRLAGEVGPEYGDLLGILGAVRPRIMATGRPFASRRRLWYELVDGPAVDHVRAGQTDLARQAIEAAVTAWEAGR
jgi:precorrin-2 dehydrogenase/sirohydrochlorin ferrochelatase